MANQRLPERHRLSLFPEYTWTCITMDPPLLHGYPTSVPNYGVRLNYPIVIPLLLPFPQWTHRPAAVDPPRQRSIRRTQCLTSVDPPSILFHAWTNVCSPSATVGRMIAHAGPSIWHAADFNRGIRVGQPSYENSEHRRINMSYRPSPLDSLVRRLLSGMSGETAIQVGCEQINYWN